MTTGRHVALLRGINVGRAKRVAMADLRALVEGLGYIDVRTLLNSGNVVFTIRGATRGEPGPRIEKAMESKLGIASRVTVLTAAEVAAIIEENPLLRVAKDHSRLLIAVLNDPSHRKRIEPFVKEKWTPDALGVGRRVAYMWCAGGSLQSRLAETVGKTLRDDVTTRNWATFLKLHAMMQEA